MKDLNILIRVDGYRKIGLGHIYRTIALSKRMDNHNVKFVSKEEHELGIDILRKNDVNIVTFSNNNQFWEILKSFKPAIVINDILDTKKDYIKKLKDLNLYVINFEDLGEGANLADVVINALYEKKNSFHNYFWGKDYYILRNEFLLNKQKIIKKKVKNILITYGGTDPNNYTKKILTLINDMNLRDIQINVILGLGYENPNTLKDEIKDFNLKVLIKQNVKDISKYMFKADIAFTSAGRTVYELASIGIPTVVLAQNERELLHTFAHEDNGIINLGLGYECSDQKIKALLYDLIQNHELRKRYSNLMTINDLKSGINNVINLIFKEYKKYKEQ